MSEQTLWSQATHTLTLIGQQKPSMEDIKTLHNGYLSDLVEAIVSGTLPDDRDAIRAFYGLTPLELKILVDYSHDLPQMIVDCGCGWNNPDITSENFPIVGTGKMELKAYLIRLDRNISADNAEIELGKVNKRAGKIEELLAFRKAFPEIQPRFPIIALGSTSVTKIDGCRRVAGLGGGSARRRLDLCCRDGDFGARCRFLAFEK